MSLRDLSVALSAGDLAALEVLREDRDQCGEGVDRNVLGAAGCTLYPDSLLARLRAHGYVIGEIVDGADRRYQLGHSEPKVEVTRSGEGPKASPGAGAHVDGSPGGALTLFEIGSGRMPASRGGMDARGLSNAA